MPFFVRRVSALVVVIGASVKAGNVIEACGGGTGRRREWRAELFWLVRGKS